MSEAEKNVDKAGNIGRVEGRVGNVELDKRGGAWSQMHLPE